MRPWLKLWTDSTDRVMGGVRSLFSVFSRLPSYYYMASTPDLILTHTNYQCYNLSLTLDGSNTPYNFVVYYSDDPDINFDRSLGECGDLFIKFSMNRIWYRNDRMWLLVPENDETSVAHPTLPELKLMASRKVGITWGQARSGPPKMHFSSAFLISKRTANYTNGKVKYLGVIDLTHLAP